MTLPAELTEPLGWIGLTWPQADEDLLFQAGTTWLAFADTLQKASRTSDAAAREVWTVNSGDAVEAFRAWWNDDNDGPRDRLDDDAEGATIIGTVLIMFAAVTLVMKIMFFIQLAILLWQVAMAIAAAFATAGASTATIPALIAIARQACIRLVKQVVKQIDEVLKKLLKRAKDLFKRLRQSATLRRDLARVNPNFRVGDNWRMNCMHCVQAWEMRRRGFDVEASAVPNRYLPTGGRPLWHMEQTWGRRFSSPTSSVGVNRAFEHFGPGSRGAVAIDWQGGGGHLFSVENIGGRLRFLDSQSREVDVSGNFARGASVRYLRLDDLPTPNNVGPFLAPRR